MMRVVHIRSQEDMVKIKVIYLQQFTTKKTKINLKRNTIAT